MNAEADFAQSAEYQQLLETMSGFAEELNALYQQTVLAYTPQVEELIRTRCRDSHSIDSTLDGLLDFCCHEPALQLFKRLCRYYWDIDPSATVEHINAYREMWDSEDSEKDEKTAAAPEGAQP